VVLLIDEAQDLAGRRAGAGAAPVEPRDRHRQADPDRADGPVRAAGAARPALAPASSPSASPRATTWSRCRDRRPRSTCGTAWPWPADRQGLLHGRRHPRLARPLRGNPPPRELIADRALLAGFVRTSREIDASMVREAGKEALEVGMRRRPARRWATAIGTLAAGAMGVVLALAVPRNLRAPEGPSPGGTGVAANASVPGAAAAQPVTSPLPAPTPSPSPSPADDARLEALLTTLPRAVSRDAAFQRVAALWGASPLERTPLRTHLDQVRRLDFPWSWRCSTHAARHRLRGPPRPRERPGRDRGRDRACAPRLRGHPRSVLDARRGGGVARHVVPGPGRAAGPDRTLRAGVPVAARLFSGAEPERRGGPLPEGRRASPRRARRQPHPHGALRRECLPRRPRLKSGGKVS
jgi:hypothetical protein